MSTPQTKPKARSVKKKAEPELSVDATPVVVASEPTPVVVTPSPAPVPEPTPSPAPTPLSETVKVETEVDSASSSSTGVEEVKVEEVLDPVEKLQLQFDNLRSQVAVEIALLGDSEKVFKKTRVLTFLRKMNRQVNMIEKQTFRLVKNKKSVRKNKVVSGFQKPTRISKDLTKFTGWNENDLHSRVEVTKYICDYIKTNNLQNPQDRRQIVPDAKLQKLLGYNPKKETEPLRYYSIQFHLNKMKHFPKEPVLVQ